MVFSSSLRGKDSRGSSHTCAPPILYASTVTWMTVSRPTFPAAMASSVSSRVIILVIEATGTALSACLAQSTLRVVGSTRMPVPQSASLGSPSAEAAPWKS